MARKPRQRSHQKELIGFYWKSDPGMDAPDIFQCQAEFPVPSMETAKLGPPAHGWTMFAGIARPKSRGTVRSTGPNPNDPVQIDANALAHPEDMKSALACVALCREIGNATALRPFVKREAMPGNLKGQELEEFIRNAAVTYWHRTCTAKMGRDEMSVVDSNLSVYGIGKLRIADGSIMPHVTTGNAMPPCVVIGERAADILKVRHNL
jgi:choline dehydrogenase